MIKYGIDPSKIMNKLSGNQNKFEERLFFTLNWYLSNLDWVENIKIKNMIKGKIEFTSFINNLINFLCQINLLCDVKKLNILFLNHPNWQI